MADCVRIVPSTSVFLGLSHWQFGDGPSLSFDLVFYGLVSVLIFIPGAEMFRLCSIVYECVAAIFRGVSLFLESCSRAAVERIVLLAC